MTAIVSPFGTIEVTVAASDAISLTSLDSFAVYKQVGYPNEPNQWVLLSNVTTAPYTYTSSAFTGATVVQIRATSQPVMYLMGTGVNAISPITQQGAPTAMTTAATITVAGLTSRIITGTHTAGATQAYTTPTGAVLDAGVDMAAGEAFDFVLINLSAAAVDTITLTAGASGITIVGNPIVQSAHSSTGGVYGNSAIFRVRKTAADTFTIYRIA